MLEPAAKVDPSSQSNDSLHDLLTRLKNGAQRAELPVTGEDSVKLTRADIVLLMQYNGGRSKGLDLSFCNLSKQDLSHLNLSALNLCGANLTYCDLRKTDLRYSKLTGAHLFGAKLDDTVVHGYSFRGDDTPCLLGDEMTARKKSTSLHYSYAWETYMNLERAYRNQSRHWDASLARYKGRQMLRAMNHPLYRLRERHDQGLPAPAKYLLQYAYLWLKDGLFELVTGYGERPLRVFGWSCLVILLFPLFYRMSSGIELASRQAATALDLLNLSVAAFATMEPAGFLVTNRIAQTLVSLEALAGIALMSLFMFTVGNRIAQNL